MSPVSSTDWLAAGGTYYLTAFAWLTSAIGFALVAMAIAKSYGQENDGCLLAISNFLLALFGGGVGLILFLRYYPYFIISSALLAILFPAISTWRFVARQRRP